MSNVHYGVIPINQAQNLNLNFEIRDVIYKPETYTGINKNTGEKIYEQSQWLLLKKGNWDTECENEIINLNGIVFNNSDEILQWKNEKL